MKLRYLGLLATLAAVCVHAEYVGTPITKVSLVSSYNQYGNGDVIFKVENPISECIDGYWLTKTDSGYPANMAMIIAAFQAKTSVVVSGLPDQLWYGSGGKYCKLYAFELR